MPLLVQCMTSESITVSEVENLLSNIEMRSRIEYTSSLYPIPMKGQGNYDSKITTFLVASKCKLIYFRFSNSFNS